MTNRSRDIRRDFTLLLLASIGTGIYGGLYDPIFNNFLADTYRMGEALRGALEFPRELPGFLTVFISGLLIALPDTRIAFLALLALAASQFGFALWSPGLGAAIFWMLTWSVGAHLYMAVYSSIGMNLAEPGQTGQRMGQLGSANTAASLLGYLLVWWGFQHAGLTYRTSFLLAGSMVLLAALCLLLMRPLKPAKPRRALVYRREYRLYYLLSVLFGARKQIFLTFGPWVLIKLFHQPASTFALLGLVGTVLGIFFRYALGVAIDRLGERKIIFWESVLLVIICLGYGFARFVFPAATALTVIYACFVIDQLLFACLLARSTYLHKILQKPEDLTPTLAMGVSVDHAVSMSVPVLGGLLWEAAGFQYVFLAAACIALLNCAAALRLPAHRPAGPAAARTTC
ncbi:MAG: MFS transporter [Desulfurispora sp.]|uniref:MFS transporter n=1 Tax=Desulfurispora sp. TaxID=3014275 RepID=UPI00404A8D33